MHGLSGVATSGDGCATRWVIDNLADTPVIHYLNTDLELVADVDLAPLAEEFEAKGLAAIVNSWDDGCWRLMCEDCNDTGLEPNIIRLLDAVESLSEFGRLL
jgi:hypothetical protein